MAGNTAEDIQIYPTDPQYSILNNIRSILHVYIWQRSPETMNSLPNIQRGQALINLLLSSRIIVDGCLEESELSLQWLRKMKVNLLCTLCGAQKKDSKIWPLRFSRSPYATATQDEFHLKCQGNLDKNCWVHVVFIGNCAVHLSLCSWSEEGWCMFCNNGELLIWDELLSDDNKWA